MIHEYTVLTILRCLYTYRYQVHSHSNSKSFMQCCGSGSAWIHIHFGWLDPDPGGQEMTKKSEEILSFEGLAEIFCGSVADPGPYVFGSPGSRPISTMYGSGSGSFYQQTKTVSKSFDSYCFMTFYVPLPYYTYLISNFQIFRIFLVSGT